MGVYRTYLNVPEEARGACIALGNFDGVHAGHRAVLGAAKAAASDSGALAGAAVFEPPPRRFFQPDAPAFRLMRPEARISALQAAGADHVFELPFDQSLASMTDRAFIEDVLVKGLGISHVAVGFDFRFGKNRAGSAASLSADGELFGFGVSIVDRVEAADLKISSTAIREALLEGRPRDAAQFLGGYWIADGVVEHGEKRGRTLGFPTANMRLGDLIHPRHGIYAVWARIEGYPGWRPGVANFGRTPTTGLRDPLLEVFLFDFHDEIYGRHMDVALVEFLRPEATFDSLDALVAQMRLDAAEARRILNVGETVEPLMDACPPL